MSLSGEVKERRTLLNILGVLSIIFGVLALSSPFIVGLAVAMIFGIALLILGVSEIFAGFSAKGWRGKLGLITLGVVCTIGGLIVLNHPSIGLGAITLVIGLVLGISGISRLALALQVRAESGVGFLLISGIVSLILSVLIILRLPTSSELILGILIGIDLILQGIGLLVMARVVSKVA